MTLAQFPPDLTGYPPRQAWIEGRHERSAVHEDDLVEDGP